MHEGVLAVGELRLRCRDERTGIDSVEELLLHQRHTGDVDRAKPLLDFLFTALANVDGKLRIKDKLLLILVKSGEILLHTVGVPDSELSCNETPERRDALLTVKNLVFTLRRLDEVYEPQRVSFQDGINNRHIFLTVSVDVVTLVLRLYGELPGQTVQALTLKFVIDETLADVGYRNVGSKLRLHRLFLFYENSSIKLDEILICDFIVSLSNRRFAKFDDWSVI